MIVSTTVGLGVFLLPYALAQSGVFFWLWFAFLALAIYLLHLAYGEIIFAVGERHNLPGLAARLLGPKWKLPVWLFDFVGLQLVFLAYLIAIAEFVPLVVAVDPLTVKLALVAFAAVMTALQFNPLVRVEAVLSFLKVSLALILSGYLLSTTPLSVVADTLGSSFGQFGAPLFPYGLILFALTGTASLPLVYDLLGRDTRAFRRVNAIALSLVAGLYAVFAVAVVSRFGLGVSEASLDNLVAVLPLLFARVTVVLVVTNIMTTLVALAEYLKRGLINDFRWQPFSAWLGVVLPLCLSALLPVSHLVGLASVTGSLFIGVNLMILLLCYQRLERTDQFGVSRWIIWLLTVIFGLGWLVGLLVG